MSENLGISQNMESYFQKNKVFINEAIRRYNTAIPYGRKHGIRYPVENYSEFVTIPLIDGTILFKDPREFCEEEGTAISTSGTTGAIKKIYDAPLPREDDPLEAYIIPFITDEMDRAVRSNQTVFLRTVHEKIDGFSVSHDIIFKKLYPRAKLLEFYDEISTKDVVKEGSVLCIYEYPSAVYRLIYFINQALNKNEISKDHLKKDTVFLELSGERIIPEDLENISMLLTELFGSEPIIRVSYGMSEVGLLGVSKDLENFNDLKYDVVPGMFVEIIDPVTGDIVSEGEEGEITATPLGSYGTSLIRYKTGDLGILHLGDCPSLEVFGRSKDLGYVHICGEKFSLPDIIHSVRSEFGLPVQIETIREIQKSRGIEKLNVNVYLPQTSKKKKQTIEKFVYDSIVNDPNIDVSSELRNSSLEINVGFKENQTLRKNWRIIN